MRIHNRFAAASLLLIGGLILIDPGRHAAGDPGEQTIEAVEAVEADGFFAPAFARADRAIDAVGDVSHLAEASDDDVEHRLHVWLAHHPI